MQLRGQRPAITISMASEEDIDRGGQNLEAKILQALAQRLTPADDEIALVLEIGFILKGGDGTPPAPVGRVDGSWQRLCAPPQNHVS